MHGKKIMNFYIKYMMTKILLIALSFSFLQADLFDFQTIDKANQAYQRGEFRESAKLFGSLKKDDPSVVYDRANALYKAGYYDDALKEYAKIKGFNEAERLHNIGNCYFKKRDFTRAIKSYERALKMREDADTRYNLELAKKKKREKDKKKNNKKKQDKREKKPKKDKQNKKKNRDKKVDKPMNPKQKREDVIKKELRHMMNRLSKKKMPTLMYRPKLKKGEFNDTQNPW